MSENPYQSPDETETKAEPTQIVNVRRVLMWGIPGIVVPVVVPLVFDYFYKTINREWTVVTFGCGCPDLTGDYRAFNANHFNLIVWFLIFLIGCGFGIYCARRVGHGKLSGPLCTVAVVLSGLVCCRKFLAGIWL